MSSRDVQALRTEYTQGTLHEKDLAVDPFVQFEQWFEQAVSAELVEPNAFVLATVDEQHRPAQRTVLLKQYDQRGFVFFTNYHSRKGKHLAHNGSVSMLFQWLPLQRQVEIDGNVEKVSLADSVKYFATRPRGSQLGAWVSQQSSVITSRSLLELKLEEIKRKFKDGQVPIPSSWGGFRIVPRRFEFWQGRANRLHDRFEYLPQGEGETAWEVHRLAP
jgi:pyridoxamine 5'-phosphate oxidase